MTNDACNSVFIPHDDFTPYGPTPINILLLVQIGEIVFHFFAAFGDNVFHAVVGPLMTC